MVSAPRAAAPGVPRPVAPTPTAVGPGGQMVRLTFTGPPTAAVAAKTAKPDYSHSSYEVGRDMQAGTSMLARKEGVCWTERSEAMHGPLAWRIGVARSQWTQTRAVPRCGVHAAARVACLQLSWLP